MPAQEAAYNLGYSCLLGEAKSSLSSSTQIFANAPAGTKEIWVTVRTAGITMRTDAGTATAGANGLDYAVNSTSVPYSFPFNYTQALKCYAIQNGGTATLYIEYRG